MSDKKDNDDIKSITFSSSDLRFIRRCVLLAGLVSSTELAEGKKDLDSGALECSIHAIRIVNMLEEV